MSKSQLKYIIFTGLFAVPFVPLVVASSFFFPFITGKAFVFRLIVEIIFACYLVLCLRDQSYRPKFSWILGALIAFLAIIGVADFFGQNSFKSFWSNYERMEGYITLLHLGAYFLVMGSTLKTQEIWNKLLTTSLGVSIIMTVYSFLQLAGKITINQGGVRVDGTFGNAAYLAIYIVFHIFIAALLFSRTKVKWHKIVLSLAVFTNLVVLYYTATRGAVLGFLGGVVISLLFLIWKSEKGEKIKKVAVITLLSLIVFCGLFITVKDTSFIRNNYVLSRFASLSTSQIQSQGRYFVWPIAIKGFIEKPILGWGQEGFNFVFNKYYDPRMYTQEPWFDRAHSTPLDWLIAGGALGLLSYLFIFVAILFYIFQSKNLGLPTGRENLSKEEKAVMLGLISAYVFNNLFVFDQIGSYILFFMILAYVHSHASETNFSLWDKISFKFKNILEKDKWHPIAEASILIILVLVLYFGEFIPWRENKNLLEVLKIGNQSQIGAIEAYAKPLSRYNMGFSESLEHVSQAVINVAANQNTPPELKQKLFDLVEKSFLTHIKRVPNDARYRLFYGLFLSRFGWYGRALEQLEEARKLSPNKQSIQFEIVNNLLLDNKPKEALEIARQAYELEPSYEEAKFVYGFAAIADGNTVLGEKILAGVDESKLIFDDRYLSMFLIGKQYQKIIEVAKRRIELDPTNMQHRITLTAAYLQAGRRQEAIQTLEEMIKIDPTFKEKGDYYINEIKAGRNP